MTAVAELSRCGARKPAASHRIKRLLARLIGIGAPRVGSMNPKDWSLHLLRDVGLTDYKSVGDSRYPRGVRADWPLR